MSYAVVKLLNDSTDVVTIISTQWLVGDGSLAKLPKVPLGKWYEAVKSHHECGDNYELVKVQELIRTVFFDHAKAMEKLYEKGQLPSSDDTVGMGTPPKRIRIPNTPFSPVAASAKPKEPVSAKFRPSPCCYVSTPSTSYNNSNVNNQEYSRLNDAIVSLREEVREESRFIRAKLADISRTQEQILKSIDSGVKSQTDTLPLPILSDADMLSFEKQLQSGEFRKHVTEFMVQMSDHHANQTVANILNSLFSYEYSRTVSFGQCGSSFVFKRLVTHSLICSVVAQQHKENGVTNASVSDIVKIWFHSRKHNVRTISQAEKCEVHQISSLFQPVQAETDLDVTEIIDLDV